MVCIAAATGISELIDGCKRFMTGSATVVRKYGMAAWLYDLMYTSTRSLYMQETSDFLEQAHWFGAYSMLRWGAQEPRSLDIAGMLLAYPRLGTYMLCHDDSVTAAGVLPDIRYRRAIDYLTYLRVSADLDYGRALADGRVLSLDGERAPEFADVDQRYAYDADRLVGAYESMWNDDKRVQRAGHDIMTEVERTGIRPNIPLWRNPAYLYDLAESLMGPLFADDLNAGFAGRDRERFDEAMGQLRDFADFVREIGFVMLPVCVLDSYAKHGGRHARNPQDGDGERRGAVLNVGTSMAAVVIARMSEDLARPMAMALMQGDVSRYSRLVLDMMSGPEAANVSATSAVLPVA